MNAVGLAVVIATASAAPPAETWGEALRAAADAVPERAATQAISVEVLAEELSGLDPRRAGLPRVWPAEGVITSDFGWRRDPYRQGWRFHGGLDVASGVGTRIRAVSAGVVTRSTRVRGYGHVIEIDHGWGLMSRYAHLSRRLVRVGQAVAAGETIGRMGSTGRSTGPHLHLELHGVDGVLDPLTWLRP